MIEFRQRAVFTLVIVAGAGVIFALTVDLSPLARLVPLIVVVPTLALLLFQLAADLVPWLEQKYRRFEKVDLLGIELVREKMSGPDQPNSVNARDEVSGSRRELTSFSWISLLLALIYVFGFLVACPAYTFLYLRWRSGENWRLSLAVAAGMGGLLYGGFIVTLRLRLYEGHLWRWLGP